MTDDERLQRIGELFAELMQSDEGKDAKHRLATDAQETLKDVAQEAKFPPGVVVLNKGDRIGFALSIKTPAGNAAIYYDPAPALEKLLEESEEEANAAVSVMVSDDDEEYQEIASDIYYQCVTQNSQDFTKLLLKLLYSEFESAVKSLPEVTKKLDHCITVATLSDWGGVHIEDDDGSVYIEEPVESPPFSITEFINRSLKELNEERKKRWIAEVNSSLEIWKQRPLAKLAFHFQQVYPLWKRAQKLYKHSQKSPDLEEREKWNENILDKIKELKDYSDLIVKLSQRGASAPYEIALRHSARLCGFPDKFYSLRHLKGELSKQGMSAKKVKSKLKD
jgi:hypothetical protein